MFRRGGGRGRPGACVRVEVLWKSEGNFIFGELVLSFRSALGAGSLAVSVTIALNVLASG